MPQKERNEIIDSGWKLQKVTDNNILFTFDCGDKDLNEYFHKDALLHKEALISQTYHLKATEDFDLSVALIDLCNDSIRLTRFGQIPDLPENKRYPFLPAVKITRLGVSLPFQGLGVGSHLINMVKRLFITQNRTGCRFLTVDAYNNINQKAIKFYQKNGFQHFSDKDKNKKTRAMFFDLKRLLET